MARFKNPNDYNEYALKSIIIDKTPTSRFDSEIGKRYGYLEVLSYIGKDKNDHPYMMCKCHNCGSNKIVGLYPLHRKVVIGCGCIQRETTSKANKTHGDTGTRLYKIYNHMLSRCYKKYNKAYHRYGKVGISVCDEWRGKDGYANFKKWAMENGYTDELTIDRKNPYGNYCPENCRWETWLTQSRNKKDTAWLKYQEYEFPISVWSEITGIPVSLIHWRIKNTNWNTEKILRRPPGCQKKNKDAFLCWEVDPKYLKYQKTY